MTRETATNQSSLEDLSESFVKYGGTARNLLSKSRGRVEEEITTAINNCTDLKTLFPTSSGFQDQTSHALIAIDPRADDAGVLQREKYQGRIASRYIRDLLLNSRNRQLADGMTDTLKMLIQSDITRAAAGILFEGVGHRYLFNSLKSPLHIRSLEESDEESEEESEEQVSVSLQHVKRIDYFGTLLTGGFKNLEPENYYQPLSSTNAGIDSFALEVDKNGKAISVVLFQFTTSMNHPVNPRFLQKLWIKGTRAATMVLWKLVFVVPLENEPNFGIQKWKSAGDVWGGRVSQYVLGVDVDKLLDSA